MSLSPRPRPRPASGDDPFGTEALRAAVLDAWAASPARFREDANAEESLTIGYADRVVAELAANAADAAQAAGEPGRLWIRVEDGELRAANTGAPLTPEGVSALASLRASAKRAPVTAQATEAVEAIEVAEAAEAAHTAQATEAAHTSTAARPAPAAETPGAPRPPAGSVGHFGVGFTAVRAISDAPLIVSTTGGVRFSVQDTRAAIDRLGIPGLDVEAHARAGELPALRLPWPALEATPPPAGFDTEVRLPLRDGVDPAAFAETLTAQACLDLIWALPALERVRLGEHEAVRMGGDGAETVAAVGISDPGAEFDEAPLASSADSPGPVSVEIDGRVRRFRVMSAGGRIPADLLADRPIEERARDTWRLTWVLPLDAADRPDPPVRTVVGAPTATDEPLTLPAALIGTLPVDDTRRHLARGPLTDYLIGCAAAAYLDLVRRSPPDERPGLIPAPGFPAGPFDGQVRETVLAELRAAPFLAGAGGRPVRPEDGCLLPGLGRPAAGLLGDVLPGLLPWPEGGSGLSERLRSVGVRTLSVADVSAALAGLDRPVAFWLTVYDALTDALGITGADIGDLADLPMPREGGGTIVGARGVLVPKPSAGLDSGSGGIADDLRADSTPPGREPSLLARAAALIPGLRIAAEGVAHPLLDRLGARTAGPAAILADPLLAAEIRRRRVDLEEFDPDVDEAITFGELIADLVAEAGLSAETGQAAGFGDGIAADPARPEGVDTGVLAATILTDGHDEPWPAGELLLPDAPLAAVLRADADLPVVGRRWLDRYPVGVLQSLGVRAGFAVVEVPLPPEPGLPFDGLAEWWTEVGESSGPVDSAGVIADLDLVDEGAWPTALVLVASARRARDALRPQGSAPSYGGWWIARHARIGGAPPPGWRTAEAADLAGLFDAFPVDLPPGVAEDVGVLTGVADAARRAPADLVARWADPDRRPTPAGVPGLTAAVVDVLAGDTDADLPDTVRALDASVIDAEDAVVLDHAWLAPVVPPGRAVAGGADPTRTAAVLDIDQASDGVAAAVDRGAARAGILGEIPDAERCLDFFGLSDLARLAVVVAPDLAVEVVLHDDPAQRYRVGWWVDGDELLVDGSPAGVGRLIAHLAGRWPDREAFVAVAAGDAVAVTEAALAPVTPLSPA